MFITAMLTVVVLAVGGPHGSPPRPLLNGTVAVIANGKTIAYSTVGNITLRLREGTYQVRAGLAGAPRPCQSRTVRLRLTRRVTLTCSVP
jgi:hypothetical protein